MSDPEIEEARAAYQEYLKQFNPIQQPKGFFGELLGGQDTPMGNLGTYASEIAQGAVDTITGIPKLIGQGASNLLSGSPYWAPQPKTQEEAEKMQAWANSYGAKEYLGDVSEDVTNMIPGVHTAYEAGSDYLSGEMKPAGEYGKMLRKDITSTFGGAAVGALAKPAMGVARGAYTGLRDFAVGKPEQVLIQGMVGRDEAFGNLLNAAKGTTNKEQILAQNAGDAAPAFVRENPVAGIDNAGAGIDQVKQLSSNLENIKSKSIKVRNDLLPEVVAAEEAAFRAGKIQKLGVGFDDIPENVTTKEGSVVGLSSLRTKFGDTPIDEASKFVQKEFGIAPEYSGPAYEGAPMRMSAGRNLSIEELNDLRKRIDGQIETIGGYDDSYWAKMNQDPSVALGYAEALRFYRRQIDGLVKDKISAILGENVADQFTKAGENISMSNTYGNLVNRFKTETGEAFTPGSAKRAPPGAGQILGRDKGLVNSALDAIFPNREKARIMQEGLEREVTAIRQLQQLVDYTQRGSKPLPRGWNQIKNSMQDFNNVANIAVSMGLIGNAAQLSQMPDEQAKQLVGIVAANAPQMFEQNPDKVNTIDGEFLNPIEKDGITRQASSKDPKTRYYMIGEGTNLNRYNPPKVLLDETLPPVTQPSQLSLPDLNAALDITPTAQQPSRVPDSVSMVDQLLMATDKHSQDF